MFRGNGELLWPGVEPFRASDVQDNELLWSSFGYSCPNQDFCFISFFMNWQWPDDDYSDDTHIPILGAELFIGNLDMGSRMRGILTHGWFWGYDETTTLAFKRIAHSGRAEPVLSLLSIIHQFCGTHDTSQHARDPQPPVNYGVS